MTRNIAQELRQERLELDDKAQRLMDFMDTNAYEMHDIRSQLLLIAQYNAMYTYSRILQLRILHWLKTQL